MILTRSLDQSGLDLPILSFGASSLGAEFRTITLDEAMRSTKTALDLGMNFIDTSPFYGRGMCKPLFPPSSLRRGYDRQAGPTQWLFQGPPAESKFLAVIHSPPAKASSSEAGASGLSGCARAVKTRHDSATAMKRRTNSGRGKDRFNHPIKRIFPAIAISNPRTAPLPHG